MFRWIKALSAHSDYRRATECRTGDDIYRGRNGRHPSEPIPAWPGCPSSSADDVVRTPTASGDHPIPGGEGDDTRSVTSGGRRSPGPDYIRR